MKIRREEYFGPKVRTFTDRDEPREVFWRKYEEVKAESIEDSSVHVLTYYGIGGIGKSRLLEKIQNEMDEKIEKPYYISTDFREYSDSRIALFRLRNSLERKYNFHFPLFDIGYYCYARRLGEKEESNDIKELTERSPLLKALKDTCGIIPYVNIISPVLDAVDKLPVIWDEIKKHLPKHKRELTQIDARSATELYKYLPYLFAKDMANNVEKLEEPFVVFIDTYEHFVNELSQTGEPLLNDLWIRDKNGLVQNIPNVLWVIGGRESLKWSTVDKNAGWDEVLVQYSLSDFVDADSDNFLKSGGIEDEELRQELCKLTNGTPLYLNLCIDQYDEITDSGRTPDISMFGNDLYSLIECFVRYMDDSQKDFMYMLSCLGTWNDALLREISQSVLGGLSLSFEEKIKNYSFISLNENGYTIHQTVGEVLFKNCPQSIKNPIAEFLIEKSTKTIASSDIFASEYSMALLHMLRAALILYDDNEDLLKFYEENIQKKLQELVDAGITEIPLKIVDMLLSRCNPDKKEHLYACALVDMAYIFAIVGNYKQTINKTESAIAIFCEILGENHSHTLNAMNNLAGHYYDDGDYKKALEIAEIMYEKYKNIFTENNTDTLTAMNNLASYLAANCNFKKALELEQTVYEKRCEILGEDDPYTLSSLGNLAGYYSNNNDSKKALELAQIVYEKYSTILGENHLDTINSMNNLATYLSENGEHEKALKLEETVYAKQCEVLGENHPKTINSMNNLAGYYNDIDDCKKALEIGETVYAKQLEILGENHPDTIISMNNLSCYYSNNGDYKTALQLMKTVYEKRCKIFGEKDRRTVDALKTLILLSNYSGNSSMAVIYKAKLKSLNRR